MRTKGLGPVMVGFCLVIFATAVLGQVNQTAAVEALVTDAQTKMSARDFEGAAEIYHRALQMDEKNETVRHALAVALVEAAANIPYTESLEVLDVIDADRQTPTALYFPLSVLGNAILGSHDISMSQPVLLVLQKLQYGDNRSALKMATTLHQQNPDHAVPYNLLGLACLGQGDPGQARAYFQQALVLKEDFEAARINLAELELHLGEFNAAHQELDTVLKQDHDNRRAYLVKAHLYDLEGQSELAKTWYKKAIQAF